MGRVQVCVQAQVSPFARAARPLLLFHLSARAGAGAGSQPPGNIALGEPHV